MHRAIREMGGEGGSWEDGGASTPAGTQEMDSQDTAAATVALK